jgi:hypothetical protein
MAGRQAAGAAAVPVGTMCCAVQDQRSRRGTTRHAVCSRWAVNETVIW